MGWEAVNVNGQRILQANSSFRIVAFKDFLCDHLFGMQCVIGWIGKHNTRYEGKSREPRQLFGASRQDAAQAFLFCLLAKVLTQLYVAMVFDAELCFRFRRGESPARSVRSLPLPLE